MSYYQHHLFFCTNQRPDGAERPSCANCGAAELRAYAKKRLKALGATGAGRARVNLAGCLDRCEDGPVLVVYPEGVWYTYVDESDLDEIIEKHILGGQPVPRLMLPDVGESDSIA
ncbi:MAG: (2Fe-2S) ferredoxin domain-containing protein [Wenzhouxiangella sp.]